MPTTDSERPRVLPLTMMNFVLTHVYCMYTGRQNGKDIAFYVFMDKEKLDVWGEDNRRPVRARERQRKRDIWHRAIR